MNPLLLCILDGVGLRKDTSGNAVALAYLPNFYKLIENYPHSLLKASEQAVGLPTGQMGNSEVGHGNIGAGRVVYQPLELINQAVKDNSIYQNKNILEVINHTKQNNSKLHIMGLVSNGGVHSNINHLLKLIDMCKENGVTKLYIHAFLDGRDTVPNIGSSFLDVVSNKLKEVGFGSVATISGRYYAMDRDNRWERIKKAYDAIVYGAGNKNKNYQNVIENSYNENLFDEFIIPTVIDEDGIITDNDGIINFNFRPDRLRELNMALTNPDFNEFEHKQFINIKLVTMMPVSDDVICTNAFNEEHLNNTLGEYLSTKGIKQLRIAETEKYAHVTYFFDGGEEKDLENCQRILIPSPKVATYDLKPEMSAYEITDTLLKELDNNYDFIVLNFANGDMVGHTGNLEATIKSLEVVDTCLGKIINKINEKNGTLIVTADHGNSDTMLDESGNQVTTHSLSLVPFIVTKKDIKLNNGKLADIAPTILELMNLEKPVEMTGTSLIGE